MHLPLTLKYLNIYNKEELDLLERSEIPSREGAGPDHRVEMDISVHQSREKKPSGGQTSGSPYPS